MRIGRTLPPAASPITLRAIVSGFWGIVRGRRELDRFESELKQYFGVEHCFLVSSGKAAFTLILLALRELCPERDEVLIPAYTCYSVPSAVVRAGLKIRLCDLQPGGLDFDFAQLLAMLHEEVSPDDCERRTACAGESAIENGEVNIVDDVHTSTSRVLAVIPTHLFGYPADVARLRKMIRDPRITIVEDAAQAMGEMVDERALGTFGDVSFFSLARGKAFSVVEGGVILTNRSDVANALDRVVSRIPRYGLLPLLKVILKALALMVLIHPRLFWIPRSIPFLKLGETLFETDFPILRMSSFQAGLARNWVERMQKMRDARKANARQWIEVLEANRIDGSYLPSSHSRGLLRFPLWVRDGKKRKTLLRESARMGMGIMPVYPASINAIPALKGKIGGGAFPVAESCAQELVTLPTHHYLAQKDVKVIRRLLSRALIARNVQRP